MSRIETLLPGLLGGTALYSLDEALQRSQLRSTGQARFDRLQRSKLRSTGCVRPAGLSRFDAVRDSVPFAKRNARSS
jgi:hypothetical protein